MRSKPLTSDFSCLTDSQRRRRLAVPSAGRIHGALNRALPGWVLLITRRLRYARLYPHSPHAIDARTGWAKSAQTPLRLTNDGRPIMRITLVGSRHFGVTTFNMLRQHGVEIVRVVVADADDRLAAAARAAGIEVVGAGRSQARGGRRNRRRHRPDRDRAQPRPHQPGKRWPPQSSAGSATIRRCCRGIAASPRSNGPSGKAIRSPAAPSIISPTAWMPARSPRRNGVFVKKGETARELWERALAPLGQKLLGEVIDYAKTHKTLPAKPQDEQFATKAPQPSGMTCVRAGCRINLYRETKLNSCSGSGTKLLRMSFDCHGTFRVAAAQQILNTLCPDKPRHHTHRGSDSMRHRSHSHCFLFFLRLLPQPRRRSRLRPDAL